MSTPRRLASALAALLSLIIPAAAWGQGPTVEQTTAVYVGTFQKQCRSIARAEAKLGRDALRDRHRSRTRLQEYRRQAKLLIRYFGHSRRAVRNLAAAVAPPEYATFQTRFKAKYKRNKVRLRRQIQAIRRAKTAVGIVRTVERYFAASKTASLPTTLRKAAPACGVLD